MEKFIGSYIGTLSNGAQVIVDEYQSRIDVTHSQSVQREYINGMKRFELRGGGAVNQIDASTFQIPGGEQFTVTRQS